MRTGFSAGIPAGIALALALALALLAAPGLRADDAPSASAATPAMQDYQNRDTPAAPSMPSDAPGIVLPSSSPSSPAPSITKPEDDNWLLKGVEAERKANEAKLPGQSPASPLKPVDPLNPDKPAPLPKSQIVPDNDPAKTKPIKPPDGIAPLVPAAPKAADANKYQPLIKGLSTDAVKPLATTGLSTNSSSALSSFKAIEAVNPDVTRPLYLDTTSRNDTSAPVYGAASVPAGTLGMGATSSGYDIPNAPSARPMGAAPISLEAPMAPTAPQARPAGSSALSSFAPIQPITVPTAPAAPAPPTARDLAPKAGPGSAIKVKDPVSADLPFIR